MKVWEDECDGEHDVNSQRINKMLKKKTKTKSAPHMGFFISPGLPVEYPRPLQSL